MQKKWIQFIFIFLGLLPHCMSQNNIQNSPQQKLWSILICTIEERKKSFDYIYNKLQNQINGNNLNNQIEILFFRDNREKTIGFKRNALLQQSSGEYVCFVDDDDDVHDNYITMIYEKLLQKPDCVSLAGITTTDGYNPEKFIHSIKYDQYYVNDGVYNRPINHLTRIKKSIALQFSFPNTSRHEDSDWAIKLAQSKIQKTEAVIDIPCYFYKYISNKYS